MRFWSSLHLPCSLRRQAPQDVELTELVALLQQSRSLILSSIPDCDELCRAIDEIRTRNVQMAQLELLQRDNALLEALREQNLELERTIRELLRQRIESGR